MRRPGLRLVIAFFICLILGYGISHLLMDAFLQTELRLYGWTNLTIVAILVAFLLVIILDTPFNLKVFEWEWPADKDKKDRDA